MGDSSSSSSTQPDANTLRRRLRSVENHVTALVKLMEKNGNMKRFDLYEKKVAEMHALREKCAKLPGAQLAAAPATPNFKRTASSSVSISPSLQAKKRRRGSDTEELDKKIRAAKNHITSLEKLSKQPRKGHLKVVISARQGEVKALQLARSEANRRKALAIRLQQTQNKGANGNGNGVNRNKNGSIARLFASSSSSSKPVAISPSSSSSPAGHVTTNTSEVIDLTQPSKKINRELFVNSQVSTSSSAASQDSLFLT